MAETLKKIPGVAILGADVFISVPKGEDPADFARRASMVFSSLTRGYAVAHSAQGSNRTDKSERPRLG